MQTWYPTRITWKYCGCFWKHHLDQRKDMLEELIRSKTMNLRSVAEILPNTRVVLRIDADVPTENDAILDNTRICKSLPTIKMLLEKQCKIAIIGHRGRPNDREENLSLKPVYLELMTLLEPNGENLIESIFIENPGDKENVDLALAKNQIVFLENLRFWKGEMNNDADFLKGL